MDCLRSFSFRTFINTNLTGANVKTWTAGAQEYWLASAGTASTYNIQGFKNIDVYGIDVVGNIQSIQSAALGGAIVEDWGIEVFINGQPPLPGGFITTSPNFYSISTDNNLNRYYNLGRYSNSLKFASPMQSVTSISLEDTYASGYGGQTAGNINLYWNLNFIVYYKFEGE